jgi:hypothetical protein
MEPGRAKGELGINGRQEVTAFFGFEALNIAFMKDAIAVGPL